MPDAATVLDGLNDAQRKAVTHGSGPLLIVAGAGTGKTTVLTRRYLWLLKEQGLTSENVLALTFTDKAAQEMEDRVLQLLPNGTYDFWISTFHSFCERVLEERGLEIGLPNRFKLLNETDGWLLLKRRLDELPLDHYRPLGNPVKFLSALLRHVSRAKDENVSPEEYLRFAQEAVLDGDSDPSTPLEAGLVTSERKRLQELADLFFAYRKILRDEGALDFGDLIQETLRLFRERPAVLADFRRRFRYILVDEFQDTNWAQYELVRLLAGESKNLTVVGDDDQAIYKFRGASLANILQFRDDYPNAETVYLTDNYRSNQAILDLAYGFIRKNDPHRLEVRLGESGLSKRLVATKSSTHEHAIDLQWYKTLEDEADGVARRILELKETDVTLTWNDFAVLVRANDGAEPFVRALEALGIPFRFYALRGLYTKPLIVDIVALLSLLDDYHEASAVWRALNLPVYKISSQDCSALVFYAQRRGISLWSALGEAALVNECSEAGRKKVKEFVARIEKLQETSRRERPLKVLQDTLEQTGLLNWVLSQSERDKLDLISLLNSFANRLKRYESSTPGPTLKGFMHELRLEIESGEEGALHADPNEGPELVKVLTVHGAKGLEFRHVFVVSLVDQRFPTRERKDTIPLPDGLVKERLPEGNAHLEEERRLFYVAMTRAKDSITFTGADDYGGARAKKPSPFLAEAGLELPPAVERLGSELLNLTPAASRPPDDVSDLRETYVLKRRFSFTQLAAFRKCPLQYKFAHVYKIPILGSYQKSFGQSVHLALHDILKLHLDRGSAQQGDLFTAVGDRLSAIGSRLSEEGTGLRLTLQEAEDIYRSRWIDEWYPDRAKHDEYKRVGLEAIRSFWASCANQPPIVKYLEMPFDWRLGEHSLKGKIDRVDELPDGSLAIWDYKTGQAKESLDIEAEDEDKEQLRIYQLALEDKGLKVARLGYIYVRGMVMAGVNCLTGDEKTEFRERLLERMDNILVSDFAPTPNQFICQYCDFKNICEFRKR